MSSTAKQTWERAKAGGHGPGQAIRYSFGDSLDFAEVEETLFMAILGTESIHGEVPARLEAGCLVDRQARTCVLACASLAGQDLNSLFCGYLRKEFGPSAFRIQRIAMADAVR